MLGYATNSVLQQRIIIINIQKCVGVVVLLLIIADKRYIIQLEEEKIAIKIEFICLSAPRFTVIKVLPVSKVGS